ncbi:hypothetical protein [Daejeonella rubra]|uniref:hypothetical protein n=1 Tax=Daejeonella rubra TaxID=990371 RepID=UPI000B89E29B|nr:hypothetical protein [Daejeonella rubra]
MLLRILLLFFIGLRGLTAEGRFGIGYFLSRKSIKISLPKAKNELSSLIFFSSNDTIFLIFQPAQRPRGPCSFSAAKKNQNATAASDAMKVSGLANWVRAAPAKAEER